jgi:NADPH-dependent FMN reductase
MNVCVLVGSLRKASFSRMLANALISLAPPSMKLDIVDIGQMPFYNEDLETAAAPVSWVAFRQCVKAADAVLFADCFWRPGYCWGWPLPWPVTSRCSVSFSSIRQVVKRQPWA